MTTLTKTFITAAAFAAIAPTAFAQWDFSPGIANTYSGPGKMPAAAMTGEDHKAMMKHESTEEYHPLHGQWRALFAVRHARSDRHLSPRSILTPRVIIAASSVTRPWTNKDLHRGGIGRASSAIARHVEHAERLPARWEEMFPLGLSRSVSRVW